MYLKKIKLAILSCLAIVMVSSCSIDEIEPISQLTEDNVVRDETSAQALLNATYSGKRFWGALFNVPASRMVSSGLQFWRFDSSSSRQGYTNNRVTEIDPTLEMTYVPLYKIINNANFLIEALEADKAVGISEARKNEMIAEAKTLRASAHFDLLIYFGEFYNTNSSLGVVVNTSPARSAEAKARSTVKETYDALIADLQFASTNGPTGLPNHYRMSAVTAQAILAKVYLFMGDYDNAATTANAVINNTDGYGLEPNYADVFNGIEDSQEALFVPFANGQFGLGDGREGDLVSTTFGPFGILPGDDFKALADAQDGVPGDGTPDDTAGYDPRYIFAYNVPRNFPSSGLGKYSRSAFTGNTRFEMRMAEVYLIYAEAEARRSGGNLNMALGRLNDIRNRAGVPPKALIDQSTLLADIRDEITLELFSENAQPWHALIRYATLGDIVASDVNPTLTDPAKQFLLPLPPNALAGNRLLEPNPNNSSSN